MAILLSEQISNMILRESKLKEEFTSEIEKLKNLIGDIEKSSEKHGLLEGALRESQEKYKALFDVIPFGIMELDGKGLIISVNKQVLEIFDCKKMELVGNPIKDVEIFKNNEIKNYFDLLDHTIIEKRQFSTVFELPDKSGNSIYIELNYYIHKKDNDIKSIYVILNNIT